MIAWKQVEREFEWDGSLRDVYVQRATREDWKALYGILRKSPVVEFRLDGVLAPLPEDIGIAFAERSKRSPMLTVKLGSVTAAFHFFTEEKIECDIDPREVKSQVELDAVLAFLRMIGDAVSKPVLLTPENLPKSEIVRYEPESQRFVYVEAKTR